MPQMAPINWLSLYFIFIMIFIMFIIKNFYLFNYKPKIFMKSINKTFMNWKW